MRGSWNRSCSGSAGKRPALVAQQKAKTTADAILDRHDKAQAEFDRVESANYEKRLLKLMRQRIKLIEAGKIAG